jgi:hypothetical protein
MSGNSGPNGVFQRVSQGLFPDGLLKIRPKADVAEEYRKAGDLSIGLSYDYIYIEIMPVNPETKANIR